MPEITITSAEVIQKIDDSEQSQGYVHLVLSNGQEIDISTEFASQYVEEPYEEEDEQGNLVLKYRTTEKTLLEYEIEQAPILAQAREDLKAAQNATAEQIVQAINQG